MTKRIKNPFKNTKLKAFFFFLILATLFWVLTKFSRQYTATAVTLINYENIPENNLITDDNLKELSFDLSTTGFEFLLHKMKRPRIDIDVRRYYTDGLSQVKVTENELIRLISAQLKANLDVRNLSVKELIINLDDIISKKIPVRATTKITYKEGFRQLGNLKIVPDSILVHGPSNLLDTINFVETTVVTSKDIDKSISRTMALQSFENKKISVKPNEVIVSIDIAEFSQKEIDLPIELVNVPSGIIIKLIPNVVTLTFNASVDDFKGITENDFKVVCDYNERNVDENFMIPRLIESSSRVVNIEFDTKKIDYLIFK